MKKFWPIFIIVGILLLVLIYFAFIKGSDGKPADNQESSPSQSNQYASNEENSPGYYVTYETYQSVPSMYNQGKVVYFFNAKWCPTCKLLDEDIRTKSNDIPKDVTIVSVDYDKYQDLKSKYSITIQHTLVQVDSGDNEIKKWNGSANLSELLKEI